MASLNLRPRQDEVLSLIADGLTDKEIAARLGLTKRTVRTYVERLFARHGVHNRAGAVRVWMSLQLTAGSATVGGSADSLEA